MNNDELVYKQKYLKYKQKYLQLKQMGGMNSDNIFDKEKTDLLDELKNHTNKLLFPTSVIKIMEKQTLSIYDLMQEYNDCLIKIRKLYNDLNKLTKWGLINDSHTNWTFSVNRNISKLNLYFMEIINNINEPDDMFSKMIKNQCGLKIEKLTMYMTIIKREDEYIWINTNTNKERVLTQQFVRELLPRCINLIHGSMKLDEIPNLEDSDNLSKLFS